MTELVEAVGAVDTRWLLGGLLLVVNTWAITLVFTSSASAREKWLWTLVIFAVPILGAVAWYVLGPKPNLLEADELTGTRATPGDPGPEI